MRELLTFKAVKVLTFFSHERWFLVVKGQKKNISTLFQNNHEKQK